MTYTRQDFDSLINVIDDTLTKLPKVEAWIEKLLEEVHSSLSEKNSKMASMKTSLTAVIEELKTKVKQARIYAAEETKSTLGQKKTALKVHTSIKTKLDKARGLLEKIRQEDKARMALMKTLQQQANTVRSTSLDFSADSAKLATTYARLEALKKQIDDLYAQILENKQRLQRYAQLIKSYDTDHPERFMAHWLEAATVILERDDVQGFLGKIIYQDLGTRQTPNTGLDAKSSVSYGAILQQGEVIQYTYPSKHIVIEHDYSGKIIDKTQYYDNANANAKAQRNLAAIKMAKLLLMDCRLRNETKMYIQGPREALPQVLRVIAALRLLAKEAGIKLNDDKGNSFIDVKVAAWNPKRWDAAIASHESEIEVLIGSGVKNEFNKIHNQVIQNLAEHETVLREPSTSDDPDVSPEFRVTR